MWACMGPYKFKMFEKNLRGSLGGLCPLLNILLMEMTCPLNHLSDSQDHSMVQEKSILND
jgi:hypothetical protein